MNLMPLFLLLLLFIAIAVALAWFLIKSDKGQKEPVGAMWLALAAGFGGALTAGFIEDKLIHNLVPGAPYDTLFLAALSVGVIEEVCKFLPLAILIYRQRYFNEHTDGVLYFALAGLGFGLPENLLYSIAYSDEYGVKTAMTRLFLTPLFHAAATGIVGYYLAKRKLSGKPVIGVVVPLGAVILLHALYNFGLVSGSAAFAAISLFITLNLTGALFLCFVRARARDQDMGLSAVGHNSFCRSCGNANPKHHLYCIRCGNNA